MYYHNGIHNGMFFNSFYRQHTMSKLSRAVKFIMGVWIVAFCFAIPQAIQFGVVSINGGHSCTVSGFLLHLFLYTIQKNANVNQKRGYENKCQLFFFLMICLNDVGFSFFFGLASTIFIFPCDLPY